VTIASRIKKLENYIGSITEDNADYSIHVGSEVNRYTKTVNGEVIEITKEEWDKVLNRSIKNKSFNYRVIEPDWAVK